MSSFCRQLILIFVLYDQECFEWSVENLRVVIYGRTFNLYFLTWAIAVCRRQFGHLTSDRMIMSLGKFLPNVDTFTPVSVEQKKIDGMVDNTFRRFFWRWY